jgi:hypothetical protein
MIKAMVPADPEVMSPEAIRILLTCLTIGRTVTLPVLPTPIDSITTPSKGSFSEIELFKQYVVREVSRRMQGVPSVKAFANFPILLGRGPSGPHLRTCISEASLLTQEQRSAFEVLAPGLEGRIQALLTYIPEHPEWKDRFNLLEVTTLKYGRIVHIPDREGKTRVITTLNY